MEKYQRQSPYPRKLSQQLLHRGHVRLDPFSPLKYVGDDLRFLKTHSSFVVLLRFAQILSSLQSIHLKLSELLLCDDQIPLRLHLKFHQVMHERALRQPLLLISFQSHLLPLALNELNAVALPLRYAMLSFALDV